jgi:carbamate kinase
MVGSHPDLCSELLARELEADVFIRATEADAVFVDWGKRQRRHLGKLAQRRHANTAFL